MVTLAVPPLALDTKLFADYEQLKRFFYLFLLKTPLAESVVAAEHIAFLDRLWQDWSPGYDAREDLANVKECLRNGRNLTAAIEYYRAEEPALHQFGVDGPYAAEEQALASLAPQPTLYLHGDRDGYIALALVTDAERPLATGSKNADRRKHRTLPAGREASNDQQPDRGMDRDLSTTHVHITSSEADSRSARNVPFPPTGQTCPALRGKQARPV